MKSTFDTIAGRIPQINSIFALVIVPLMYLFNYIIFNHSIRLILNLIIFYYYFGHFFFKFVIQKIPIIKIFVETHPNLPVFPFSLISGILLNLIYGLITIPLHLYQYHIGFFIFFEFIGILICFYSRKSDLMDFSRFINHEKKSYMIIYLTVLFPTIFYILYTLYNSPYPYLMADDVFVYQGFVLQISNGFITNIYWDLSYFTSEPLRPIGFMILSANIFISTNIPFSFLIEFDKIGIFFTHGLTSLFLYLTTMSLTKNKYMGIIPSIITSGYVGTWALCPRDYVPSSYSWLFGIFLIWFLINFLEYQKKDKDKFDSKQIFTVILIGLVILAIGFAFHFFTSLYFIPMFYMLFYTRKNKFLDSILGFCVFFILLYAILGRFIQVPLIDSLIGMIFGSSEPWSLALQIDFFNRTFPLLFIVLGVFGALILVIKTNKHRFILLFYLGFLILFFTPIAMIFRSQFIIIAFWMLTTSMFIKFIRDTVFSSKDKQNRIAPLGINSKVEIFFEKLRERIKINSNHRKSIFIMLVLVFLIISTNAKPYYNGDKVYDSNINRYVDTYYLYTEFQAGEWISNNLNPEEVVFMTDPSLARVMFGLTGFNFVFLNRESSLIIDFHSILHTSSSSGLNKTKILNYISNVNSITLEKYSGKSYLFLVSPRTCIWATNINYIMDLFIASTWLNTSLIENIEATSEIQKIFSNEHVFIYNFTIYP